MTFDIGRIRHDGALMHYSRASNGSAVASNWKLSATGDTGVVWTPESASSGGGGTDLGWFNVEDYGAVHDGSTDDTTAIQDTIDACAAAEGGTVYFPAGLYVIGGSLQDTGAFNGQLLLPNVSHSGVDHIVIRFKGPLRPGLHPVYGDTVPLADGYAVLKSTLTGASGTAAVISGGNNLAALPTGGNNLEVVVEDLICLGPDNPTFSFWNLTACQGGKISGLQISTPGAYAGSPTQPTNTNSYGIKLPQRYFANHVNVKDLASGGFYTGVLDGELCVYDGLILGPLIYGIEFAATDYPSLIVNMTSTAVQRTMKGSGDHRIDVLQYVMEHATSPSWAVTVYDVDDASNHLYGFVRWFCASSGGGGPDHSFVTNGAANLGNQEVGSSWGGSALTIKDEGSSLATAATSIDFVGSGVTASGTGAAKTVTIGGATAGQLLIADTHSTPLIFGDLLQTEAQDDLLYADS